MRSDEGGGRLVAQMDRMENDRIAKRVYVEECADSHLLGGVRKKWTDTVNKCLKKEVWMLGKQGEGYIIGVYGGGL